MNQFFRLSFALCFPIVPNVNAEIEVGGSSASVSAVGDVTIAVPTQTGDSEFFSVDISAADTAGNDVRIEDTLELEDLNVAEERGLRVSVPLLLENNNSVQANTGEQLSGCRQWAGGCRSQSVGVGF